MTTIENERVGEVAEGPKNGAATAKVEPVRTAAQAAQIDALADVQAQKFVDTVISKEKVLPADEATAALLSRAQISDGDAMLEVFAAKLSEATGIPMRVANMPERLARAKSEGKITNEKLLEVLAASVPREVFEMMASQVAPAASGTVPVSGPAAAQAASSPAASLMTGSPAAPPSMVPTSAAAPATTRAEVPVATGGFFQRRPAAGVPAAGSMTRAAPRAAPAGAPNLVEDPLIDFGRVLNRVRRKPQMYLDPDHRIPLLLEYRGAIREDEDVLIPERGSVLVVGRIPDGVDFDLADLRVLQMHPYALDRLLVASVAIDDVPIMGQGPATPLGRGEGSPSGTVTRKSQVVLRLRNVSASVVVFAVAMVVSPYREVDDGSGHVGAGG